MNERAVRTTWPAFVGRECPYRNGVTESSLTSPRPPATSQVGSTHDGVGKCRQMWRAVSNEKGVQRAGHWALGALGKTVYGQK